MLQHATHQPHEDLFGVREVVRAYREQTNASTLIDRRPRRREVAEGRRDPPPVGRDEHDAGRRGVGGAGHVATPEAVAALLGAMKDKDKLVRGAAARALGRVGAGVEGVTEALTAALKDRARTSGPPPRRR